MVDDICETSHKEMTQGNGAEPASGDVKYSETNHLSDLERIVRY
jgi:hypothetical protein